MHGLGTLGDHEYGGIVLLSHPENYNHPELLRIWPEDSNDRKLFVNIAPPKTKDWLLVPGNSYTLRYRLIIFNGQFTKAEAETGWQQFIQLPDFSIHK